MIVNDPVITSTYIAVELFTKSGDKYYDQKAACFCAWVEHYILNGYEPTCVPDYRSLPRQTIEILRRFYLCRIGLFVFLKKGANNQDALNFVKALGEALRIFAHQSEVEKSFTIEFNPSNRGEIRACFPGYLTWGRYLDHSSEACERWANIVADIFVVLFSTDMEMVRKLAFAHCRMQGSNKEMSEALSRAASEW